MVDSFRDGSGAALIPTAYRGGSVQPTQKGSKNRQKTVLPLPIRFAIMDINQKASVRPLQADQIQEDKP
ncbi:hypothetical protein AU252_12905 [Pseudarthrobacter sulfonivorans]|uniref:Uncharacterized protein n=1 Tax=Pseudarthrobacter sulfonivorans TaxID=121292 RepID=A0A0U3QYK4_9MICC|nr:hypothetical protein AU252_12905 [Pseudarthrobacter sulfonivorans]